MPIFLFVFERPKQPGMAISLSSVALQLAKQLKQNPRNLPSRFPRPRLLQ